MKYIRLILLTSILFSCTQNINTIMIEQNKPLENKVSESVKPSILTNSNTQQKNEIIDILAFPEYLVLNIGEEKELHIKVKDSSRKYNDDFIILSSNPSILSLQGQKKIRGLRQGTTQLTITPKNDISQSKVINIEVKDIKNYNEIVNYNEKVFPSISNSNLIDNFVLDYNDDKSISKIYYFNNSLGYQKLDKINKTIYKFIPRINLTQNYSNNQPLYDLFVDIYNNDSLKNTIKISDFSYNNIDKIYPVNSKKVEIDRKIFKNRIITDSNNNFYIVYINQFNEYILKSFNKDGVKTSETVSFPYKDSSFSLGVSPNGNKIIFSQMGSYNMVDSYLEVEVLDKDLKSIYKKTLNTNTESFYDNRYNYFFFGNANINDLGELVLAWGKSNSNKPENGYIHLEKININNDYKTGFDFNTNKLLSKVESIFINNNSDINIFWSNFYDDLSLFTRYIPSDKHKDFTYLKANQHYKLDTKYNKCVSSNEDVITIKPQDSLFYSNQVGTATVTCFDENDYSKNNVIKINVGF